MTAAPEKIAALNLVRMPLADVNRPHPKNPRDIPPDDSEEIRVLDASLSHDYFDPIVWNSRNGLLVSGHVRVPRLIALGFTHADVSVVDYDEATHEARLLAGNDHSGKNNEDKLDALLTSLRTSEVDPVLALLSALPPAPPPPAGDADAEPDLDRAAELNKIWQVETGQVWQIGNHRLMCGSSTEAADVARLLNGAKPRLMITDPPYGVEYDANWRKEEGVVADSIQLAVGKVVNDDIAEWLEAWNLSPAVVVYIWHADLFAFEVERDVRLAGFEVRNHIIWNKNSLVISRGSYHPKHETALYAVRKGGVSGWTGDRKQTTVWDIDRPQKSETGHSTQKPVECMARPMRNHSGDVHDPFLGSGTTMVAAQNLQRICYGMEISPDYCAVILDRMQRAFPDLEIKRVA
jgi:DNA modification methylase